MAKARDKREARRTSAKEWAKQQTRGFEPTAVRLPEGTEYWKPELGTHSLDFMLYRVGANNPRADAGMEHFERQYSVHRIPMPNGRANPYCCLWECFQKKCPVCEYLNERGSSLEPELARSLKASTRHLWVVNDKPGSSKNPLKVFDTNHYNRGLGFGEMLVDAITGNDKYANFAELEGGMTLRLTVKEQTWPGGKFNAVTRIDFVDRDYTYAEDMIERAPCLDECLIEAAYGELKKFLNQGSGGEDEELSYSPPSSSRSTSNGVSVDKEEKGEEEVEKEAPAPAKTGKTATIKVGDFVEYDGEECEVKKVNADGTINIEDEEGDLIRNIETSEVTRVGVKEDEEEAPRSSGKTQARSKVEDEEEENEEEDEDEEEEDEDDSPPRRGKR